MKHDIAVFEKKLTEEKARLESELSTIAHPEKGAEKWEAIGTITDQSIDADPNEVADKLEEFETNQAITDSLNTELRAVDEALERIKSGTFGMCEKCDNEIEEDRLMVNPSARTCKAHMN